MRQSLNPKKVAVAVFVAALVLFGLFKVFAVAIGFFTGSNEFSPEEINSILQNKEEDIVTINKVELTAQSLQAPYLDADSYHVKNWDVVGNAIVRNNEFIRLTSDNQHQVGNMFNKMPIQAESFEMELTFHIHAKKSNFAADGMAIWFLDQKSDIGDVFGAKNRFNGLGIMIDTYKNGKRGQFPFVNLMLGDGNTEYQKWTDGYDTRLAGCNAKLVLNPKKGSTKARIVYIKDGYFSLDFNYDGVAEHWVNCVTLTDVKLPLVKYLGFTAETGEISEAVDVIENKMYALFKPDGSFISSIDELKTLILEQNQEQESQPYRRRRGKAPRKQTRKTLSRLKKAEERIKQKERQRKLDTYGDPEMYWFKFMFFKLLRVLKYCIYGMIAVILVWFCFILFRVVRQKKKTKVTGLLD